MQSQSPPMPEHAPPAAPSAPLYHQPTLGVPLKGINHQVPPNTWLDTDGRTNGRTNRGTDGWTQATCHTQDECVRYCLLSLRRCIQCVLCTVHTHRAAHGSDAGTHVHTCPDNNDAVNNPLSCIKLSTNALSSSVLTPSAVA